MAVLSHPVVINGKALVGPEHIRHFGSHNFPTQTLHGRKVYIYGTNS